MKPRIDTCIIPVAGMGKRLRPISQLYPKELIAIGNIPLLAFVLKEVRAAGLVKVILIVNPDKQAIFEKLLELINKEPPFVDWGLPLLDIELVTQMPLNGRAGLGAAVHSASGVLRAANATQFALILPDVLIDEPNLLKQMMAGVQSSQESIVALNPVPHSEVVHYGIAEVLSEKKYPIFPIARLIEKPSPEQAPSNLAVLGRYILPLAILDSLEKSKIGTGNEIQITDAINALIAHELPVSGFLYSDSVFDCGQTKGLFAANQSLYFQQLHTSN